MKKTVLLALALACTSALAAPGNAELKQQVADTERAFAATMAKRDHQAFISFLAEETIFFNGPKALRGKDTVAAEWKAFYDKPEAPFSWEPDTVEVLDSGTLAHSSGPVRDPQGKVVSRFNSIWRLEAPGKWRIVFDKGERVCDCKK
ncbi:YybH family protein [Pseudoduganella sp. OTU4001]|uniref:YybH family protein n=1 Tax=Pseudoduganella sp. OTU4001 TaxID=3043854 RepID=UPI00313E1406